MGIKVHNTQDNTFKDNTHNIFNANFKHIQHSYQDVSVYFEHATFDWPNNLDYQNMFA